jgi:hypothetical protein
MDDSKAAEEKSRPAEPEVSDMLTRLTQEAEQVIAEASAAASREAELELERILSEYEQKTKQIVLKVREETKLKAAEIARKLSAVIMLRIEKASARAITGVVAELGARAGELTQKMQEAAEKEAGQVVNRAVAEKGDTTSNKDDSAPQKEAEVAEAEADNTPQSTQPVAGTEDFDQWLTH